jgi:hypothetical protein
MFDRVNDMIELLDVINKINKTSFLQDDNTNTFIIVFMTHIIKEVFVVWKGPYWESFFSTFIQCKGDSKGCCLPM